MMTLMILSTQLFWDQQSDMNLSNNNDNRNDHDVDDDHYDDNLMTIMMII